MAQNVREHLKFQSPKFINNIKCNVLKIKQLQKIHDERISVF